MQTMKIRMKTKTKELAQPLPDFQGSLATPVNLVLNCVTWLQPAKKQMSTPHILLFCLFPCKFHKEDYNCEVPLLNINNACPNVKMCQSKLYKNLTK
jgi:hypothetical protein